MGTKQQVFTTIADGVMTVKIDNPELKNGLDWYGINELADCYERLIDDKNIRVAVFTGNDQYFYTGGRVEPSNPGESEKYADALLRYLELSGRNQTPAIAAVSGDCMKAGMGLLCSCDFAVAREGVVFNFPEVRMGGVPMMVLVDTVDVMPKKRALEALLTSWDFSAEDAYMMGLVNRVVPAEKFNETVDQFVQAILNTPPHLIEMTKRAYSDMVKMNSRSQREDYAYKMLKEQVLVTMAKTETIYNV